jgi:DNA-binding transcriptional MerR regulator
MTDMKVYESVESVAKMFGLSPSTVKKYYGLFEKAGYRYKRNNQGYIIFDSYETDLFKELIFLKNQPGMTVSKAVREIVQREGISDISDDSDTNTDVTIMSSQVTTIMTDIEELKEIIKKQNEMILHQTDQAKMEIAATAQLESLVKQLPQPKEPEEERHERMTNMITRRRVEGHLRMEALQMWSQKPTDERMVRVGWFRKEEDINKRDIFIEAYTLKHIEERVKKEYDLHEVSK